MHTKELCIFPLRKTEGLPRRLVWAFLKCPDSLGISADPKKESTSWGKPGSLSGRSKGETWGASTKPCFCRKRIHAPPVLTCVVGV